MKKTDDFMALERAVHSMRDINIQVGDEFCAYMGVGRPLLDLAEQISERDETDTDSWNELIRTIHTIEAGTDDIPDKDEVGRVRQKEKGCKCGEDEIIPVRARHIEEEGCKCGGGGCRSGRPEREAPLVAAATMSSLGGQVTGGFSLAEILPLAELLRAQILSDIETEQVLPEEGYDYYFRAFETMRGILRMFPLAISEELFPPDVLAFYFKGELGVAPAQPPVAQAYIVKWTPHP